MYAIEFSIKVRPDADLDNIIDSVYCSRLRTKCTAITDSPCPSGTLRTVAWAALKNDAFLYWISNDDLPPGEYSGVFADIEWIRAELDGSPLGYPVWVTDTQSMRDMSMNRFTEEMGDDEYEASLNDWPLGYGAHAAQYGV